MGGVREWREYPGSDASRELARAVGLSEVTARCLVRRGVADPVAARRFLSPTLAEGLRSPMLMRDMREASDRVLRALERRERIAVYGDYDVDGMTGAAILLRGLREFGADPFLFVPDRLTQGYGLSLAGIEAVATAGATLMITADCGASSHAEIAHAASRGIDVVVCDHHSAPAERPPATAVLNPIQPGCGFPFKGLCGAGVAFYLLAAVRMRLRESAAGSCDLRRYLDLVAIGTIADVVPLRDENRTLVSQGLKRLGDSAWPGLRALMASAAAPTGSARAVAFRIAPRLNASGRVGSPRDAVQLLTESSAERALHLVGILEACNQSRRAIETEVMTEARSMLEAARAEGEPAGIVVWGEGWHPGVVGIVAARLAEQARRPIAAIAVGAGVGRGSARSIPGVDVLAALRACGGVFERLGGHPRAAGFTIASDRIEELRRGFAAAVAANRIAPGGPDHDCDAALDAADFTADLAEELGSIEPCGEGNPEPILALRGAEVLRGRVVGGGHLSLDLVAGANSFSAIAFGVSGPCPSPGARIDLLGVPEVDEWRGRRRHRLRVTGMERATAHGTIGGAEIPARVGEAALTT